MLPHAVWQSLYECILHCHVGAQADRFDAEIWFVANLKALINLTETDIGSAKVRKWLPLALIFSAAQQCVMRR
jgi:hypothetical protein